MSFLKDYKAAQLKDAGYETVPVIKMAEAEGKPFTVKDYKLVYDLETDYGTADTAILTIVINGEKRTLFIRQKWLFAFFENAFTQNYAFTADDKMKLVKKVKGDKTFWDLIEA